MARLLSVAVLLLTMACGSGEGAAGPQGVAGPAGDAGPPGAMGSPGNNNPTVTAFVDRFGDGGAIGTDDTVGAGCFTGGFLAQVFLFAGNFPPSGAAFAHGQILSISTNTALFSLLGTNFGGNGTSNFALPDMRGLEPAGVNYCICTAGVFPSR
jgi:hypothetical protein